MDESTEPTIGQVLRKAFELRLTPTETFSLVRQHHPDATNDDIMAAFQSRLAEIAREKAIADDWYERERRKLERLI
jgi:hypothetical protein